MIEYRCLKCGNRTDKIGMTAAGTKLCNNCGEWVRMERYDPNQKLSNFDDLTRDMHEIKEELSSVLLRLSKYMNVLMGLEELFPQVNRLETRLEEVNRQMIKSLNEITVR